MVPIRIKRSSEPFDGRGPTWVDCLAVVTLQSASLPGLSRPLSDNNDPGVSEAVKEKVHFFEYWLKGLGYDSLSKPARNENDVCTPCVVPHSDWGARAFFHQSNGDHIVVSPIDTGAFLVTNSKHRWGANNNDRQAEIEGNSLAEGWSFMGSLHFSNWDLMPIEVYMECTQRHCGDARKIMRLASCARSRLRARGRLILRIWGDQGAGEIEAELYFQGAGEIEPDYTSPHGVHKFPNPRELNTSIEWRRAFESMARSLNIVEEPGAELWIQWWEKPLGSPSDHPIWSFALRSLFIQKWQEMSDEFLRTNPSSIEEWRKLDRFCRYRRPLGYHPIGFSKPFHPKYYTVRFATYIEGVGYFVDSMTERYPGAIHSQRGRPRYTPQDLLTAILDSQDDVYTESLSGLYSAIRIIGTSKSFPKPHAEDLLDCLAFVCAELQKFGQRGYGHHRDVFVRLNQAKGEVGTAFEEFGIDVPTREPITEEFWRNIMRRMLPDLGDPTYAKGRDERFSAWWSNTDRLGALQRCRHPAGTFISDEDVVDGDPQSSWASNSM